MATNIARYLDQSWMVLIGKAGNTYTDILRRCQDYHFLNFTAELLVLSELTMNFKEQHCVKLELWISKHFMTFHRTYWDGDVAMLESSYLKIYLMMTLLLR